MKLLFVVTEDWYFLSHRLPIAEAALRAGYEVAVATRVTERGNEIFERGFKLIPLQRFKRESLSPPNEALAIAELRSVYRREQPDIIHHVALKAVMYGSIAALGLKVKIINAIAGLGFMESSRSPKAVLLRSCAWNAFRFLLNRPNSVTLLQNFDDRDFAIKHFKVSLDNTEVIMGSGVDTDLFTPSPEPEGVPVVMLPSRMLWNKGIKEFVAAAEMVKAHGVKARFVLVGDSDIHSPSAIPKRQLLDWHDSGSIEWWGHQTAMHAVLPQANIICLPSYREGLPKSLIEAAACGRAIVTTDVPGCNDVVQNSINGYLVSVGDAETLAIALQLLISRPDLRAKMGSAGRQIASHFSQDVVCEKTLALYESHVSLPSTSSEADSFQKR
jgi:glycosyltransferase involved in cell wall biosynthesis